MKWHNKDKEIRRNQWYVASAPRVSQMSAAKDWCDQHQSSGKYYYHYTNTRWWFERKEDAAIFAIVWG